MLLRIIAMVSIVFLLMIDTYAAMNGTVIAVQATDAWAGGNLTLISIPSLQKKTLLAEPVGGPCLSPDRSKVGFIKDGKIQYVNSDGSSTAPVNTGIAVDVSIPAGADRVDIFGVALYWLNLNGAAFYNIKTKERINIGQYMGYDYYPGPVGVIETSASEPVFNPPSGVLAGGMGTVTLTSATAGAAIRYTLDGSVPTLTTGTVLPSTAKIELAVAQGQTITVKAIAYKSGVAASVVTSAQYRAPDSIAPFTFITPVAGSVMALANRYPLNGAIVPV